MDIRYINERDWIPLNDYLSSKKAATIYHSRDWKNILTSTYKFTSHYLIALENNLIKGFLPLFKIRNIFGQKKLISLPYSHLVPILYDSAEACSKLLNSAESIARSINTKQIVLKAEPKYLNPGWSKFSDNYISILGLDKDIDLIKKNIKNSTLRNVKKAEKENVKIKIGSDIQDYRHFYEVMVDTRQRQGSPPYSRKFFEALHANFDKNQICLFQALKDDCLLGGVILFYFGDRAVYAYGASVSDKSLMRARPNELLFWTAIKDAWEKGYSAFDFGITPFYNKSLLHFKSRWGVETYKTYYSYYSSSQQQKKPAINRESGYYRMASKLLTTMPRPMIKILGPQMLKYVGY